MPSQNTHVTYCLEGFYDNNSRSTGKVPEKKSPCYEEIDAILGDKPTTMPTLLISSSGTSSNISTDNSDSDSTDDEVPLQELNSTNVPVSTSRKPVAGSRKPFTEDQNKYSLGNENADDEIL